MRNNIVLTEKSPARFRHEITLLLQREIIDTRRLDYYTEVAEYNPSISLSGRKTAEAKGICNRFVMCFSCFSESKVQERITCYKSFNVRGLV